MTPTAVGLTMFGSMLVLMALRVPIAAAMFIPGAVGYWALNGEASLLNLLKGSAVARLTVYDLSVIPLFLLMGQFATQGGLSRALFGAAMAWVGHVRGGLGMASVMAAGAFGAGCGSSVATSATITQVAYPEMRGHGWSGRVSTATLAAGGTLGILIPPSVPLVVYAILTEQNIAKLFAAAMVPGVLAMLGYIAVLALLARWRPELAPAVARQPQVKELCRSRTSGCPLRSMATFCRMARRWLRGPRCHTASRFSTRSSWTRRPPPRNQSVDSMGSSSSRGSGRSLAVVVQRSPERTTPSTASSLRPASSVLSSSGNHGAGVNTRPVARKRCACGAAAAAGRAR